IRFMADAHPTFHIIAKPIGPICNLDCTYCYYLEKEALYPRTRDWTLNGEPLRAFIEQYIAAQDAPVVHFTWQGGEPTLLGLDYFRNVVQLQRQYSAGKQIENALQTNGMLLDDEWCEFLARERFLVGLSIDGPEHLHDAYRVGKSQQSSFHRVMAGLDRLRAHSVEFNTLTVVHRRNADCGAEVYNFLKGIGSRYLQFLPAVERSTPLPAAAGLQLALPTDPLATVTDWSVRPEQYGQFLCDIFDIWVQQDVAQVFVQLFDVTLENWLGMTPALCVFRETCGGALAVEHNGDVYACDHYVFPEYRIGNVAADSLREMVNSPNQIQFGNAKASTLPQYCRDCDVRFACHGECPKNRFIKTPDGEAGLNYLCAGYKQFFHHVGPCMQYMADELR
ncbi:uncharacterized protein SAMN05421753_1401, partial [Planctomicrobium piriforme]